MGLFGGSPPADVQRDAAKGHRWHDRHLHGKGKIPVVMGEFKRGTLRSGGSGKKVTNRKQAIAIAMSEAGQAITR